MKRPHTDKEFTIPSAVINKELQIEHEKNKRYRKTKWSAGKVVEEFFDKTSFYNK